MGITDAHAVTQSVFSTTVPRSDVYLPSVQRSHSPKVELFGQRCCHQIEHSTDRTICAVNPLNFGVDGEYLQVRERGRSEE